jgi:hypothetical protein
MVLSLELINGSNPTGKVPFEAPCVRELTPLKMPVKGPL